MSRSIANAAPRAELQSVSGKDGIAKAALQKVSSPSALVSLALNRSALSQKEAAITMGISESLLARQLKGDEHLSWQRLFSLPDRFWLELLIVLAESRGIATVRTQIEFERKSA